MVLGAPLLVLALLCGLAVGSMHMLGAVRAYVTGESLWSKGRSLAVMALDDYAASGRPDDLARFHQALLVSDGDRRAREAMLATPIDLAAARQGFLDGGNQAGDIDAMIGLFRLFGRSWIFQDSLAAWMQGDVLLAELRREAEALQALHAGRAPASTLALTRGRIQQVNVRLLAQEKRFIGSLNEAAHNTERILQACLLGATLLMSGVYVRVAGRTLQRRTDDARVMQRARDRWELAVAAAGLGRYDLDIDANRYALDPRGAELYGLPAASATKSREEIRDIVHPQDRDASRQLLDDAIREGHIVTLRYRVTLPDGRVRHLENTGRLDRSERTRSPHLIGVLRDVTEEIAQAQLTIQRDAAERIAVSQRAFLSRLSHELRTPLNAILGFAQLLDIDRNGALSAPQHQQVSWILRAGRQLLGLVEDVLDLSKVEAGEVTMRPQPVVLQQLVRDCLPLIENVRAERQVTLLDALPEAPLWVQADPQRLQQVVINLLSNGCKYNSEGGQLGLSARQEEGMAVLDVCDTGQGLSRAEQAELFQPFKRPARRSAQVEGTGLGLYIVRQLVERMGGSVSVRSEPGAGACFTLRLPALPPPDASVTPRSRPEPQAHSPVC